MLRLYFTTSHSPKLVYWPVVQQKGRLLQRGTPVVAPTPNSHTQMLSVSKVSKRYGEVAVFSDLSLTVNPGEVVFLTGPSGRGTSPPPIHPNACTYSRIVCQASPLRCALSPT